MSSNYLNVPEQLPCPHCDRVFPNAQALSGHAMSHVAADPCPECGRDDFKSKNAQSRHRSQEHGVVPAYRAGKPASNGKIGRPRLARVDTEVSADDIFQSVVQSLYPGGQMPTWAMTPLVQWREATRAMLERVQSE